MPAATLDHGAQAEASPLLGRTIGKYGIQRKLGEGGMGTVYEARHQSIGQRSAIKILHPQLSRDPKSLQRFFNEARAISSIHDAGLVKIFDHGQMSDGLAYIIMEFLEGEPLSARLDRVRKDGERMPPAVALRLIGQVAATLKVAHQRGIVHRDLKPENVFLIPDPVAQGGERTKLLDFGIAKFLTDAPGRKTTVGMVLGTPTYMAPEQCEGREDLSDKVDVYALGVMLYELLADKPPFQAESASTVMRQHMFMEPPPLQSLARTAPKDVCALVRDMLVKDPSNRPSMAQVLERLAQIESGRPARGAQRLPLLVSVALLLVVGVGTLWWMWPQSGGQARRADIAPVRRTVAPSRPSAVTPPVVPAGVPAINEGNPKGPVIKAPGRRHRGDRRLPTLDVPVAADGTVSRPPPERHRTEAGQRPETGGKAQETKPDEEPILR